MEHLKDGLSNEDRLEAARQDLKFWREVNQDGMDRYERNEVQHKIDICKTNIRMLEQLTGDTE